MDIRLVEAFARLSPGLAPIAAVRAAMREAWASFTPEDWEQINEGAELSARVPEIRARAMNEFARTINAVAAALAAYTGRAADDFQVRVLAGAVIGVMMSVFIPDHFAPETDVGAELLAHSGLGPDAVTRIDEALALLERGLPL
jgi:MftR C-terminal domain